MMVFGRLKTGFQLAGRSLQVLEDYPKLLVFPIISAIGSIAFLGALVGSSLLTPVITTENAIVLFLYYLGTTFITSYSIAALMWCSNQAFQGQEPSIKDGLRAASRNLGPLLTWSIISAIVGMLIRAIEENDSAASDILAAIFGMAWTAITYFVLPVIVFEDTSTIGMFSRSKETLRSTWGESIGALSSISIITFLLGLLGTILGIGTIMLLPGVFSFWGLLIMVVFVLVLVLIGQTLTGIAKTALYIYAIEGQEPEQFDGMGSRF